MNLQWFCLSEVLSAIALVDTESLSVDKLASEFIAFMSLHGHDLLLLLCS